MNIFYFIIDNYLDITGNTEKPVGVGNSQEIEFVIFINRLNGIDDNNVPC